MLSVLPITWRDANEFVRAHHRHSGPTQGCKWALACVDDDGVLRGVALAGRPVARNLDDGLTCEVTRVCTDGAPNACSLLYASCRRIGRAMGYTLGITYTLASESGHSVVVCGGVRVAEVRGEQADRPSRRRARRDETPGRVRWHLWDDRPKEAP